MKARVTLFVVGLIALSASIAYSQRGNPNVAWEGKSVDELIANFMKEKQVDGMSLAIVQAPYITRTTGYGIANRATGQLVGSDTVFGVGQMIEAYTAVAVMQLVETGKLKLDAMVTLEGVPSLTLQHLLLRDARLTKVPREFIESKLQEIVATASGESYETFVRKNQFERLGLKQTFFAADLPALQAEAERGGLHTRFLQVPELIDPTETAAGNPAKPSTGIFASAYDISVWDVGLAGEILIRDPALRKLLYQPGAVAGATGPWRFPGHRGLMIIDGKTGGYSAFLSRFTDPADLLCVTLLANREGLDLEPLARKIAGAFDPRLGPSAPTP